MYEATLSIGGIRYGEWTELEIQRSVEALAPSFSFTLSGGRPGRLQPGQRCKVDVDGRLLITGYIDDVEPSYDATAHTVTIRGRGKTGDLVDCSAKAGKIRRSTLAQIAADLCLPFGILVSDLAQASKRFSEFTVDKGETVFDALHRAARMRGVLLASNEEGDLVITRTGTERAPGSMERGKNILKARGAFSWRDRFSEYTVIGQAASNDNTWGPAAGGQKGVVRDAGVDRHRPLTILAEEGEGAKAFHDRAHYERNVRFGRSARITYTVAGWGAGGTLWKPNTLVAVRDDYTGLDGEMLIAKVTFRKGAGGTLAELELTWPEALDVLEIPEKKLKGGLFG